MDHNNYCLPSTSIDDIDTQNKVLPDKVKIITKQKRHISSSPHIIKSGDIVWITPEDGYQLPFIKKRSLFFTTSYIVDQHILGKFRTVFSNEVFHCIPSQSFSMNRKDAIAFNKLTRCHFDETLDKTHTYNHGDGLVNLDNVEKLIKFLTTCRDLIIHKITYNCLFGFMQINDESEVPFVWHNGKQLVPLFYFEGSDDLYTSSYDLDEQWKIVYLKFCCKVQKVNNIHWKQYPMKMVDLKDVMTRYPLGTRFETSCPTYVNQELLAPEIRVAALHASDENLNRNHHNLPPIVELGKGQNVTGINKKQRISHDKNYDDREVIQWDLKEKLQRCKEQLKKEGHHRPNSRLKQERSCRKRVQKLIQKMQFLNSKVRPIKNKTSIETNGQKVLKALDKTSKTLKMHKKMLIDKAEAIGQITASPCCSACETNAIHSAMLEDNRKQGSTLKRKSTSTQPITKLETLTHYSSQLPSGIHKDLLQINNNENDAVNRRTAESIQKPSQTEPEYKIPADNSCNENKKIAEQERHLSQQLKRPGKKLSNSKAKRPRTYLTANSAHINQEVSTSKSRDLNSNRPAITNEKQITDLKQIKTEIKLEDLLTPPVLSKFSQIVQTEDFSKPKSTAEMKAQNKKDVHQNPVDDNENFISSENKKQSCLNQELQSINSRRIQQHIQITNDKKVLMTPPSPPKKSGSTSAIIQNQAARLQIPNSPRTLQISNHIKIPCGLTITPVRPSIKNLQQNNVAIIDRPKDAIQIIPNSGSSQKIKKQDQSPQKPLIPGLPKSSSIDQNIEKRISQQRRNLSSGISSQTCHKPLQKQFINPVNHKQTDNDSVFTSTYTPLLVNFKLDEPPLPNIQVDHLGAQNIPDPIIQSLMPLADSEFITITTEPYVPLPVPEFNDLLAQNAVDEVLRSRIPPSSCNPLQFEVIRQEMQRNMLRQYQQILLYYQGFMDAQRHALKSLYQNHRIPSISTTPSKNSIYEGLI